MMGLDKYLYNEGFAYRLLPMKPDTTVQALEATHTDIMYHNMMDKFKWGNMKNAKYLDHESIVMFYPIIQAKFSMLVEHLMKEGKMDQARKVLQRYDDVQPDLYPYSQLAGRKCFMAGYAYKLGAMQLGNKWLGEVDDYVTNLLDYYYALSQNGSSDINSQEVQMGMYVLNNMMALTKESHQDALYKKYEAQFKDYSTKLSGVVKQ